MKFKIYVVKNGHLLPVVNRYLCQWLNSLGDQIVQKAREFIAEGNPDQVSGQQYVDDENGIEITTWAWIGNPDRVEAGEQPIFILITEEDYQNFVKLSEVPG